MFEGINLERGIKNTRVGRPVHHQRSSLRNSFIKDTNERVRESYYVDTNAVSKSIRT